MIVFETDVPKKVRSTPRKASDAGRLWLDILTAVLTVRQIRFVIHGYLDGGIKHLSCADLKNHHVSPLVCIPLYSSHLQCVVAGCINHAFRFGQEFGIWPKYKYIYISAHDGWPIRFKRHHDIFNDHNVAVSFWMIMKIVEPQMHQDLFQKLECSIFNSWYHCTVVIEN